MTDETSITGRVVGRLYDTDYRVVRRYALEHLVNAEEEKVTPGFYRIYPTVSPGIFWADNGTTDYLLRETESGYFGIHRLSSGSEPAHIPESVTTEDGSSGRLDPNVPPEDREPVLPSLDPVSVAYYSGREYEERDAMCTRRYERAKETDAVFTPEIKTSEPAEPETGSSGPFLRVRRAIRRIL